MAQWWLLPMDFVVTVLRDHLLLLEKNYLKFNNLVGREIEGVEPLKANVTVKLI